MEFVLLGYPPDAPALRLDHEQFAYAGKFVTSGGRTIACDPDEPASDGLLDEPAVGERGTAGIAGGVVGATSFDEDRDAPERARIRYVTVREDRRGEGIGPRLLRFTAEKLGAQFEAVAIAVNNPIAYQACYRAGFVWTGRETGMAELLLSYDPGGATGERYRAGFEVFAKRDLPDPQRAVVARNADATPPALVAVPGRD